MTLFPEMCGRVLDESIIGRSRESGLVEINCVNIRDFSTASQLVCLSNMESLNAVFISDGFPQAERLTRLNKIAIEQMRILTDDGGIKRFKEKNRTLK